jgi:hypothetical protein
VALDVTLTTDLRQSFEGLSDLVTHHFKADPLSGHLYGSPAAYRAGMSFLKFERSGESLPRFARRVGVKYSTLARWVQLSRSKLQTFGAQAIVTATGSGGGFAASSCDGDVAGIATARRGPGGSGQ